MKPFANAAIYGAVAILGVVAIAVIMTLLVRVSADPILDLLVLLFVSAAAIASLQLLD